MGTPSPGPSLVENIGRWSRRLGVSVRPYSGRSPHRLLLAGTIQIVVSVAVVVYGLRMVSSVDTTDLEAAGVDFRWIMVPVLLTMAVTLLLGVAKAVIGVLDLVPRLTVTGTVVSLEDRMPLDFLPRGVHYALFNWIGSRFGRAHDRRTWRTEVVLDTPDGIKQWTVHSARTTRMLARGANVRLVVTPLTGHIARVEPLAP